MAKKKEVNRKPVAPKEILVYIHKTGEGVGGTLLRANQLVPAHSSSLYKYQLVGPVEVKVELKVKKGKV